MNNQYIVNVKTEEREEFISYLKKLNLKGKYKNKEIINSKFPIVIDFNEKIYYLLESITCCAMASQSGKMISKDEFINSIN